MGNDNYEWVVEDDPNGMEEYFHIGKNNKVITGINYVFFLKKNGKAIAAFLRWETLVKAAKLMSMTMEESIEWRKEGYRMRKKNDPQRT